jgi:hypothetical protein
MIISTNAGEVLRADQLCLPAESPRVSRGRSLLRPRFVWARTMRVHFRAHRLGGGTRPVLVTKPCSLMRPFIARSSGRQPLSSAADCNTRLRGFILIDHARVEGLDGNCLLRLLEKPPGAAIRAAVDAGKFVCSHWR